MVERYVKIDAGLSIEIRRHNGKTCLGKAVGIFVRDWLVSDIFLDLEENEAKLEDADIYLRINKEQLKQIYEESKA